MTDTPDPATRTDAALLERDDRAWDAFVESSTWGSHLQLSDWRRAKSGTGWRAVRVVVEGSGGPIGAQVLLRRIGPGPWTVGYAPRGPIAGQLDGPGVLAFSEALRRLARRARMTHVTIDPAIEAGVPEGWLEAAGWQRTEAVQHEGSRLIDLSQPEEALWTDLRQTSRRYVNRARRDGCVVREGGSEDLAAFHAILVETAERSGFIHRSLEAYRDAYEALAPGGRARLLFCDLPDGTPAATKMLLRCGDRVSQPYSGMTRAGAASYANYLLEWETIVRSRAAGARIYDMWGRSTSGIAYFKEGFGGRAVDYCGAWDLVTSPLARRVVRSGHRAWVRFARWRRGLRAGGSGSSRDGGSQDAGA